MANHSKFHSSYFESKKLRPNRKSAFLLLLTLFNRAFNTFVNKKQLLIAFTR